MRSSVAKIGRTLVHLTVDFWVGLVCVIITSVGLSLTLGLGITVIGGAVALFFTLLFATWIAHFERARANAFLNVEVATPPLVDDPTQKPRFGVFGRYVTSRTAWNALAYMAIKSITGMGFFAVVMGLWGGGVFLLTVPIWGDLGFFKSVLVFWSGVADLLVIAPFVTLGCGAMNRALVVNLLGPSTKKVLQKQVAVVSAQRNAAVDGAEAERRRIERDLHDGAQQRLVALGMTIGLAKEKLDSDPAAVRALLNEAHTEAKSAMTELRSIARGIHPAVLEDRGLDAALSSIAARAPIPVSIHVDLPQRIGATLESTAYYVVSEALTNIAKHADATHAFVNVDRSGLTPHEVVVVTVTDNGNGGATFTDHGGLTGLKDRVVGVGGAFYLLSPTGGPTTIVAELPR
jgi:signal transduction histidine kinase